MFIKVLIFVNAISLLGINALPPHPLKCWDPKEGQPSEEHERWMAKFRDSIANRDDVLVKPEHLIAHDKFNVADGFGVELDIVDEMQFKGDPVLAVEKEMSKIRDMKRNRGNKKSKEAIWGNWLKTIREGEEKLEQKPNGKGVI